MPKRATPIEEENWESTTRSVASKRAAETARRIAARNTFAEMDDDETTPVRGRRRTEENAIIDSEPKKSANGSIQSGTNPGKKRYDISGEGTGKIYTISTVCNKALELCSSDRHTPKSRILHEALEHGVESRYYELARIYDEIIEQHKNGASIEELESLRKKLGTITKKTQQRNRIEGTTIKVCLMTLKEDDSALNYLSRETGTPRSLAVEQCLRTYLSEYITKAEELIALFGID